MSAEIILCNTCYFFLSFVGCVSDRVVSPSATDNLPERDVLEVQSTLEQNKENVFAVYKEKIKIDPSLNGIVKFSFVIMPDGTVTKFELVESTIADLELVNSIRARIESVNFGVRNVTQTKVVYAFSFSPE